LRASGRGFSTLAPSAARAARRPTRQLAASAIPDRHTVDLLAKIRRTQSVSVQKNRRTRTCSTISRLVTEASISD
jgi:hypothetical protein